MFKAFFNIEVYLLKYCTLPIGVSLFTIIKKQISTSK